MIYKSHYVCSFNFHVVLDTDLLLSWNLELKPANDNPNEHDFFIQILYKNYCY